MKQALIGVLVRGKYGDKFFDGSCVERVGIDVDGDPLSYDGDSAIDIPAELASYIPLLIGGKRRVLLTVEVLTDEE